MITRARPLLALALTLVGLGASAAAMADTLAAAPAWCAASGCATVQATGWSHPLGVPLPVIGVAFFATMLMLCATDAGGLRRVAAIGGAVVALGLVGVQAFVIGAWCTLCLVADGAALLLAATILTARTWPRPARDRKSTRLNSSHSTTSRRPASAIWSSNRNRKGRPTTGTITF